MINTNRTAWNGMYRNITSHYEILWEVKNQIIIEIKLKELNGSKRGSFLWNMTGDD